MPNFCARIEGHRVVDVVFTFTINVIAADGATYQMDVEVPSSTLAGNINSYNQAIKDAVEAKLLSDFSVTVGVGNKIVLMGGGV